MNVDIPEYNDEHCKGCVSYLIAEYINSISTSASRFRICGYAKNNKDGKCPCSACVVKVMCVDPCDDYNSFGNMVDHIGL